MGIIAGIIVGAISGCIAGAIMGSKGGLIKNIILGLTKDRRSGIHDRRNGDRRTQGDRRISTMMIV